MATDVRGHEVPASDDQPARSAFTNLSLSIRDIIYVANSTAQAQLVTDLAGAGITPSSSNPIYTHRASAPVGRELEYTMNGTTWHAISAGSRGPFAMAAGIASGSMASQSTITVSDTFPASRFTVAPLVTGILVGSAGYVSTLRVGVASTTASGVTFVVNSVTGATLTGSINIVWQAVQMTSSTAAG